MNYVKNKGNKYSKFITNCFPTFYYLFLEVIYVCYIHVLEILYNDVLLCISFQLHIRWHHSGSKKSTMVKEIIPQKLENATNQGSGHLWKS